MKPVSELKRATFRQRMWDAIVSTRTRQVKRMLHQAGYKI